jgi:hypothetical protein
VDEAPVCELSVDNLVLSVDDLWRRLWCSGDEGFEKAEGGERGSACCASGELADPVQSRWFACARSITPSKVTRRAMGSDLDSFIGTCIGSEPPSPCLILAGGEGGGGPTGYEVGAKMFRFGSLLTPMSLETTCITVLFTD